MLGSNSSSIEETRAAPTMLPAVGHGIRRPFLERSSAHVLVAVAGDTNAAADERLGLGRYRRVLLSRRSLAALPGVPRESDLVASVPTTHPSGEKGPCAVGLRPTLLRIRYFRGLVRVAGPAPTRHGSFWRDMLSDDRRAVAGSIRPNLRFVHLKLSSAQIFLLTGNFLHATSWHGLEAEKAIPTRNLESDPSQS